MPTVAEVRAQYPQYSDMSDDALAGALHQKFYSDMPRAEFNKKIGLGPDAMTDVIAQATGGIDPAAAQDLSKYAVETVKNVPSSAVKFAGDIVQPIIHPIDTATNIKDLGKGMLQKVGLIPGDDAVKNADAVGKFFKDRYGGGDEIAKTIKEDPVGFLADLSVVLTGGGSVAARAPGVVGKVGETVANVGRTVDPLNAVSGTLKATGKIGAEVVGGLTGTGGTSLKLAAEAGAEGGSKGQAFVDSLRGNADAGSAVSEAKAAVAQIRADRGAEYRASMAKIGADNTVLNFNKIDAAVSNVAGVKNYKGVDISPATADIRSKLVAAVDEWRLLPPGQFHTAEGLDALKQKLGDIRDATLPNTPERVVADQVYQGVRKTIIDQAPEYAKAMKGYEDASKLVGEIEKTLSLKPGASIDTSLRKLQSVLRNNVNTNYGNRSALVDYLESAGAPNLLTKLAGQSLSSYLPRGLGHVSNTTELVAALHELTNGNPKAAAAIAALLPASSPRLAGETAFKIGQASRLPLKPAAATSFQLGRTDRALQ